MPPKKGGFYYAVRLGRTPGVYRTWDDCKAQVDGFHGAKYQKFDTADQAAAFVEGVPVPKGSNARPGASDAAGTSSSGKSTKRTASMMGPSDESQWSVVYSDGACKGNGKPGSVAGIGVYWGQDDPRNIAERCPGDQTNNRAELIAILRLLEETPASKKPLLIKTDSKYSIQCLSHWLPGWIKNGWKTGKKEPVKNAGIIRLISAHLNYRAQQGQIVELAYVEGHSGHEGNDGADYQANLGALLPEVPERDWAAAERELLAKMKSGTLPAVVETKEVVDIIPPTSLESPKKRRRVKSPEPVPDEPPKQPINSSIAAQRTLPPIPPKSPLRQALRTAGATPEDSSASKPIATVVGYRAFSSSTVEMSPSKISRLAAIEAALPPSKPKSAISELAVSSTASSTDRMPQIEHGPSPQKPPRTPPFLDQPRDPDFPGRALWVAPSMMPVKPEDVDINDYTGCLLSDEDLRKDLEE